ncbi:hypothetical protein Tco_0887548 [Tanacetum coccineum]
MNLESGDTMKHSLMLGKSSYLNFKGRVTRSNSKVGELAEDIEEVVYEDGESGSPSVRNGDSGPNSGLIKDEGLSEEVGVGMLFGSVSKESSVSDNVSLNANPYLVNKSIDISSNNAKLWTNTSNCVPEMPVSVKKNHILNPNASVNNNVSSNRVSLNQVKVPCLFKIVGDGSMLNKGVGSVSNFKLGQQSNVGEGISRIVSIIRVPIIMDKIITSICEKPYGRASNARVLVEVDAAKGLIEFVKIWYRNLGKKVHVEADKKTSANDKVKSSMETRNGLNDDEGWQNKTVQVDECIVTDEVKKNNDKGKNKENKDVNIQKGNGGSVSGMNKSGGIEKANGIKVTKSVAEKNVSTKKRNLHLSAKTKAENMFKDVAKALGEENKDDMMEYYLVRCDDIRCNEKNRHYIDDDNLKTMNELEDDMNGSAEFIVQDVVQNVMHFELNFIHGRRKQFISFVYANNFERDRKPLWDNLMQHEGFVNSEPWVALGDFNVALNVEDCSNYFSVIDKDMEVFRRNKWNIEVKGFRMFVLAEMLKNLKRYMRNLNRLNVNVFDKVKALRVELKRVQQCLDKEPENVHLKEEEYVYCNAYRDIVLDSEKLLKHKMKIQWLKEGD